MPSNRLKDAIEANLHWLRNIRLTDSAEAVWLAIPGVLAVVVFVVLLAGGAADVFLAATAAVAHLICIACIYLSASRSWLWKLALIVTLSEINLLIYVWVGGPKLQAVIFTYAAIAVLAVFASSLAAPRIRNEITALHGGCEKEHCKWLVTRAPLSVRRLAQQVLNGMLRAD